MGDRDPKTGRFLPGNKPVIVKGNCGGKRGHPKTIKTEVKDALKLAENAMPEIIQGMINRALDGDEKAAEYLTDRIYGKANQPMSGKFNIDSWMDLIKSAQIEQLNVAIVTNPHQLDEPISGTKYE